MQKSKYTQPARDYLAQLVKPGGSAAAYVKSLCRDGGFTWTYDASKARRFTLDQVRGAVSVHNPALVVEPVRISVGPVGIVSVSGA